MTDATETAVVVPVDNMTVPKLKAELKERGVVFDTQAVMRARRNLKDDAPTQNPLNAKELRALLQEARDEDAANPPPVEAKDDDQTPGVEAEDVIDADATEDIDPEEAERQHVAASQDIAVREPAALPRQSFNDNERELIARLVAPGHTADELALFERICIRTGLDPFARQIYSIKRNRRRKVNNQWITEEVATPQTSIDGFRLIAHRTGRYAGQTPPEWCGPDGAWTDVWLKAENPAAARVGVFRVGFAIPLVRTVTWKEFGADTATWKSMPALMLGKVAESQALRAAFPQELSGLYTEEEMAQAVKEEGAEHSYAAALQPARVDAPPIDRPKNWTEIIERLRVFGPDDEYGWPDWLDQVATHLYGKPFKELDVETRRTSMFQKACRFVVLLDETHDPHFIPPLQQADIVKLWAQVLDGDALDVPAAVAGSDEPSDSAEDIPFDESVGEQQDALTDERDGFDTTREGGATP